ncbi:MAG: DUF6496 domain-containing protein [Betaproteobacteria bacterium]
MARYGEKASSKVEKAMHEEKRGTLKMGRSGKTVERRKQAIAIGLSEARKVGAKVPAKNSPATEKRPAKTSATRKSPAKKSSAKKSTVKQTTTRKTAAKTSTRKPAATRKTPVRKSAAANTNAIARSKST